MNLCVYSGSSRGERPSYAAGAGFLGRALAERQIGLVYGGAAVGLMGTMADAALAAGGQVVGVLPEALSDLELAHKGLSELRIVESMHERKLLMAELSDGFIALPGGLGTLEELVEVWTWTQLGVHEKPVGLLNVDRFYDPLLGFLEHMVTERFLKPVHRDMLIVSSDPIQLIDQLVLAKVPNTPKWIDN